MEFTDGMKIVKFAGYCSKCKHEEKEDDQEPCNECLSEPARQYTHQPLKYEAR